MEALIRGGVLIVGLSLRLTDSRGPCAAETPDLVNVCLWGLISTPYINCLDSTCRQSLSILLRSPAARPSVSLSLPALYILFLAFVPQSLGRSLEARGTRHDAPLPSFLIPRSSVPNTVKRSSWVRENPISLTELIS